MNDTILKDNLVLKLAYFWPKHVTSRNFIQEKKAECVKNVPSRLSELIKIIKLIRAGGSWLR